MAGRVYDYTRPQATTKRLIGRFGTPVQLRRGESSSWPTTAVFIDYKSGQIDGTRIQLGDFTALIAATDVGTDPRRGDALFWGDAEREVVSVTTLKPGPTSIMYTLQLRGPR